MFTGIVQATAKVVTLEKMTGLTRLTVELPEPLVGNIVSGASIAVNGTCLTVVSQQAQNIIFDVMMETLRVTNLAELKVGDVVNIERAAKFGDEIGGHVMSGHVHCQGTVVSREEPENNCRLSVEVAAEWMKYILPKGFIGFDGASLTVGEVANNIFSVYLIPETLRITRFDTLMPGDKVNIEIDSQTQAIVDTLARMRQSGHL